MELDSPESPPLSPVEGLPRSEDLKSVATTDCQQVSKLDAENETDDFPYFHKDHNVKKEKVSNILVEKYRSAQMYFEEFNQLLSYGDLNSIYRNRQCFVNLKLPQLVRPAEEVFNHLPASRPAVYNYISLLIHENVHQTFNKRENSQNSLNVSHLNDASKTLIDVIQSFAETTSSKISLSDILKWICNLSAELVSNNSGRPSMVNCQKPESILTAMKTFDIVGKTIELMDLVITIMIEKSPDVCMKVLFDASRHGSNFNWVWLHITLSFPGSIITHLLTTGAEQFKYYIDEITAKISQPTIVNAMHNEYRIKLASISDVFNFLMRKRNPELQDAVTKMIVKSLNSEYNVKTKMYKDISLTFFFKLVTCSMETLRILITHNQELITPWNVIRAARQISSIDKTIILPNATYGEFIKSVVEVADPKTHGVFFETLVSIIYDRRIFEGENLPNIVEENTEFIMSCVPILDIMLNHILRIAHSPGSTQCPSQHPSLRAFAYGKKLQFVIDSIGRHVDRSGSIIRHLHSIAIANGEIKAGEIVLRFLMSIKVEYPQYMYVLMAFITTTAKFFPNMMDYMYREFFGLKALIEMSIADELNKENIHLNILNNLRILFEWESAADDMSHISFLRLYPGEFIGEILNILIADSILISYQAIENDDLELAIMNFRMTTKLLDSVCSVNSQQPKARKLSMPLSRWYKLMAQLSTLLKQNLLIVGRRIPHGISVFEEMRTSILLLLYNGHLDAQMQPFVPLFTKSFVTSCLSDSQKIFGETINENSECLLDETGINKLFDLDQLEHGPSVIDGLRNINMRDSALDMVHSGKLKRRKVNDMKRKMFSESEEIKFENEKQRVYVLLDALRAMCVTGSPEIQIQNSKQVANVLLEMVCQDSLAADFKFDEWELESEYIHRHVAIDRKISQSTLCDGIMRLLSETRSFAYLLPIMKAQLAVIINSAEKSADRNKCSDVVRAKLHRWMLLANRSNLVPSKFTYICDLEYITDSHETFLMLLEVWRFLGARNLTSSTIDSYLDELLKGELDEGLPNEKEALDRTNFDVVRIVLQNHITEAYHLYPKLFPVEYNTLKLKTID